MLNRAVLFTKKIGGYKFGNNVGGAVCCGLHLVRVEKILTVLQAHSQRVVVFSSSGESLPHCCTVALVVPATTTAAEIKLQPSPRLATGRTKRTKPIKKKRTKRGGGKIAGVQHDRSRRRLQVSTGPGIR